MKRKVFVDTSAWLALVNKSDAAHQKARKVRDALLKDHIQKDWSLTDCTSFEVMKERRITEAFTTDKHFEQAGFDILMKT